MPRLIGSLALLLSGCGQACPSGRSMFTGGAHPSTRCSPCAETPFFCAVTNHRGEPGGQRRVRAAKDRARRRRRLHPATRAHPQPPGRAPALTPAARRAREPLRPPQPGQVLHAGTLIREPRPELLIGPRIVSATRRPGHPDRRAGTVQRTVVSSQGREDSATKPNEQNTRRTGQDHAEPKANVPAPVRTALSIGRDEGEGKGAANCVHPGEQQNSAVAQAQAGVYERDRGQPPEGEDGDHEVPDPTRNAPTTSLESVRPGSSQHASAGG